MRGDELRQAAARRVPHRRRLAETRTCSRFGGHRRQVDSPPNSKIDALREHLTDEASRAHSGRVGPVRYRLPPPPAVRGEEIRAGTAGATRVVNPQPMHLARGVRHRIAMVGDGDSTAACGCATAIALARGGVRQPDRRKGDRIDIAHNRRGRSPTARRGAHQDFARPRLPSS
jgi:hypothetical protein